MIARTLAKGLRFEEKERPRTEDRFARDEESLLVWECRQGAFLDELDAFAIPSGKQLSVRKLKNWAPRIPGREVSARRNCSLASAFLRLLIRSRANGLK